MTQPGDLKSASSRGPGSNAGAVSPGACRSLVTGGAGFIGSHLVELLLRRGDHVTVIDDLSTGRLSNLEKARSIAPDRLRVIEADLARTLAAFASHERFDEIYHLAAAVGVRRVVEQPIESIETNVMQTSALLSFAVAHGVHGAMPRTLIASSSEVYGKGARTPFAEDDDVVYGPTTAFRWSYAASKAIDEYLTLAHHAVHALPAAVVRFFNTVGPRQVGDYGMVLPNFVRAALAGSELLVHGDGQQSRCFCDVRDVVPTLPQLLDNPACVGRVFNVGSDQPVRIIDLAETVVRTLGSTSRVRLVSYDEAFARGLGIFEDLRQRQPDLKRIRSAIGFKPSISMAQTIRDVADDISARRVAGSDAAAVSK